MMVRPWRDPGDFDRYAVTELVRIGSSGYRNPYCD